MNPRSAYYADRHLERLANRIKRYILPWSPSISSSAMNAALRECYDCVLYGKDQVKRGLIWKYRTQVSKRLIFEDKKLQAKGEEQSKEMWRNIIYAKNPFLQMVSKHDGFQGKYIPVPLAYGASQ